MLCSPKRLPSVRQPLLTVRDGSIAVEAQQLIVEQAA